MAKKKEKRRTTRMPLGMTFEFQMKGAPGERVRGTISDLSPGGMGFRTDAELEEGMLLHLALSPKIQIRGEVRSERAIAHGLKRYGVAFHRVDVRGGETPA